MSTQTTITITDDSGITLELTPQSAITVSISEVGVQGPRGPALIWVGPTAPDPDVYPLWLNTTV